MPKIGIKPPKGFYANGTEHDQKGRWNSGSLVRWIDDVLRPIGGSRRWSNTSQGTVPYRGLHAWLDLSRNKWLAFGAHNIFKAVQGSGVTFIDLTPSDLGVGRQDAEYEDGYGYGLYGSGTYGMPIQQLQDGALDPATTWDIDNFGEILIACHSDDGRILEWNLAVSGGSNLLDATNANFSLAFGTDASSNGGLGGGGWTESPSIGGGGWEVDTSAQTCTYTPNSPATTLQYEVRGLTIGQKYRIRGTRTGSGSLRVSVRAVGGNFVTDINSGLTINTNLYNLSNDTNSPYFEANAANMYIQFTGDTFGTSTTTISNMSFVSAPVLTAVTNAPVNNKGVLVTDERFVFALGSGGNPRKIAFSDREDRNTWTPAATNEAGDIELNDTGEIMCGVKTRGQTLILTTTSAHTMRYIGAPYVYSTNIAGSNCGVISKKAAVNTEAGVFWMGDKSFYYFDGNTVRDLNCDVLDFVFNDFDYGQKSKIFAWVNSKYNEVWWHYLNSSTVENALTYKEPNRYVSYNYKDNYWMIGDLLSARTSGIDAGIFEYPLTMWNLGLDGYTRTAYIQEQEVGTNFGDSAFAEAGGLEIGKGDNIMKVSSTYPIVKNRNDVRITLYARDYVGDTWSAKFLILTDKGKKDTRFQGREIKYKVEGDADVDWRFSELRFDVTEGGKR